MDGGFYQVGRIPLSRCPFFSVILLPRHRLQKGWWPLFALGRIFGVHVTPKKTKNTVDVFRSYWVPCE